MSPRREPLRKPNEDRWNVYKDASARIAVGGRIVVGTYKGDGASGRQVKIGFKCFLVIVQWPAVDVHATWITSSALGSMQIAVGDNPSAQATPSIHAEDGIVVSGVFGNQNGAVHTYVAVGEL